MQSLCTVILLFLSFAVQSRGQPRSISTFLVFGDSTVDSGNNNFIATVAKSNFRPYGQDFPAKVATGRFSNGKLMTDFAVSHLGIKELMPPYLDPNLSVDDLKTGVSFASAGTGFDPLTSQIIVGVIPMEKQLEYFKEYKTRMEGYIGKSETEVLIRNAAAALSAGTNDFIENYFLLSVRNKTYSLSEYQNFILGLETQMIQGILDLGIRNLLVVGLPSMGCPPFVITLESGNLPWNRKCVEWISAAARDYNSLLQAKLNDFRNQGANVVYVDIYSPLDDIIQRPQFYGFNVVDRGCCGTGTVELAVLCTPLCPVCSNASDHVFWDSAHPTEAVYGIMFRAVLPTLHTFLSQFV